MSFNEQQYIYDEDWDNWKVGDTIVWCDDIEYGAWTIKKIDHGYVYWDAEGHSEQCTRDTNLLRRKPKI